MAAKSDDVMQKSDDSIKAEAKDDDFVDDVANDIGKDIKSFEDEVKEAHSNEIDEEFKPQEDSKPAKSQKRRKAPKKETQDSGLDLVEDTFS